MKKLVFASVMALASISLVTSPMLRSQDSNYHQGSARVQRLSTCQHPNRSQDQSRATGRLSEGLSAERGQGRGSRHFDRHLSASWRCRPDAQRGQPPAPGGSEQHEGHLHLGLHQERSAPRAIDPKTGQSTDPTTCDDAAMLAQKGLDAKKPAATSDDDWKKLTGGTYPAFHSAIALDDILSKKDIQGRDLGVSHRADALSGRSDDKAGRGCGIRCNWPRPISNRKRSTRRRCFKDAAAKVKDGNRSGVYSQVPMKDATAAKNADGNDLVQAVWFYARAWNFAPANLKTPIEAKMKFYYTKYHGNLDGLDAVKAQAAEYALSAGDLCHLAGSQRRPRSSTS